MTRFLKGYAAAAAVGYDIRAIQLDVTDVAWEYVDRSTRTSSLYNICLSVQKVISISKFEFGKAGSVN